MRPLVFTPEGVSSKTVADITGKGHRAVMRDIKLALERYGNEGDVIDSSYISLQNKRLPCYILSPHFALTLIGGYNHAARRAILDHISEASVLKALSEVDIPEEDVDMFVYAMREKDTGNIKIGISRNPRERLKQLQIGNSSELELVATKNAKGKYTDETRQHKINAGHCIRSEWFSEDAKLI